MMRVFNNPEHEFYGPARRAWVILVGMSDIDHMDICYKQEWGVAWDVDLVSELASGLSEAAALREVIFRAMLAYYEPV